MEIHWISQMILLPSPLAYLELTSPRSTWLFWLAAASDPWRKQICWDGSTLFESLQCSHSYSQYSRSMMIYDRQRVLAFPIQTCTVNCPDQFCRPTLTRVYDLILKLKVKHLLCAVQASDRTAQFQNIPFSTFAESFSGLIVEFSFDL